MSEVELRNIKILRQKADQEVDVRIPVTGTLVLAWKTLASIKGVEFKQMRVQLIIVHIHQALFLNSSNDFSKFQKFDDAVANRHTYICIWVSGGSSGGAVGYQVRGPRFETSQFFIPPLGLLKLGENKGGEESNGKVPLNALCQKQSGPYSWFSDDWTKRGTHITLLLLISTLVLGLGC
ncbi:hypothetical protein PoB_005098000 [Plakobranchus ocellatus]|uniref:Uncharacterized protein n=1 Tax=Plakobranchus ocellatus TaxID=259542 RepID=A0AAV4BVI3_9GAST|nr:hypothetical protein PoB_005098000 [Plakobranchus ocellatus]